MIKNFPWPKKTLRIRLPHIKLFVTRRLCMTKWILLALMALGHFSDLSAKERKASLHALIICDTSPSQLKTSYANDSQRLKQTLETVAFHTKLRLQLKECSLKRCSPKLLRTWIQNLPYASRDIAFVYYVGRPTYIGNNEWPSLAFSKSHCGGGSKVSSYDEKMILPWRTPSLKPSEYPL